MTIKNNDELAKLIRDRMKELGLNYYQIEKRNPELNYHAVKRATEGSNILSQKLLLLLNELGIEFIVNEDNDDKK